MQVHGVFKLRAGPATIIFEQLKKLLNDYIYWLDSQVHIYGENMTEAKEIHGNSTQKDQFYPLKKGCH